MKILFVCTGNTCRSPLAQAVLQEKISKDKLDIETDSAGVCCGYGDPMSDNTTAIIQAMDISFKHTSQPVTQRLVETSDMVVTMTRSHKAYLKGIVADEKLFCIDDITGKGDILDPFGGDIETYKTVEKQLRDAMDAVIEKLDSIVCSANKE